jgi:hypothetical protein
VQTAPRHSLAGLLLLTACALPIGQQSEPSRPVCPEAARDSRTTLGVEAGQQGTLVLDAGKPGEADGYGTHRPGPLVSSLESSLGSLPAQRGIHPESGSTPGTLILPQRVLYTVIDRFE